MKKTALLFLLILITAAGCSAPELINPDSACIPLSRYSTLILSPFNLENTIVEELKYSHLPQAIAKGTIDQLKDQIEKNRLFRKVSVSPDCADLAVRLETKIVYLVHNSGEFDIRVSGRFLDCQNRQILYTFTIDEEDENTGRLAMYLAENIYEAIENHLHCNK